MNAEKNIPPLLASLIKGARRALILTHNNPDGDALGSSSALARAMAAAGAEVDLAFTGSWSDNLAFLLEGLNIIALPGDFSAYDLILLLDCHAFARLEAEDLAGVSLPPLAAIDHHPLGEDEKTEASWLIQPEASSTGELIWRLISVLGLPTPPLAAAGLLTALASDTGFFSQKNTTAEALRAGAELLERGGRLDDIHFRLRANLPLRRLKLMGLTLESLSLHCDGRLALMTVTPDSLRAAGAVMADTEEFVDLGRNLAGVTLSALIKDDGRGPGRVRVSLRSREPFDAAALAALFGGGGHKQAAAYNDPQAADAQAAAANLLAWAESFL